MSKTAEIAKIRKTLDSLQSRVQELTADEEPTPVASAPKPVRNPAREVAPTPASWPARADLSADQIRLLREGFAELLGYTTHKSFPEFFGRLADASGLRMLLLKKWTSGLQVYLEKNIRMPAEAKKKRQDGRAPIPCKKNDIFAATGEEATVYAGPVPVQHFPLDLTLMLGRGSRDRQIIIVPLPSQNHWNTFLYLDADEATDQNLVVAELLAHFALSRMCLLTKGVRAPQGQVAQIRKAELARRRQAAGPVVARPDPTAEPMAELDVDPFAVAADSPAPAPEPEKIPLTAPPLQAAETQASEREEPGPTPDLDPFAGPDASGEPAGTQQTDDLLEAIDSAAGVGGEPVAQGSADADLIEVPLPKKGEGLTPELILQHSGELPALPKAACHIMAVIEDPRTTATRLEKALAMDQALTAKVLRIANSPFYGAVREIRTVSEAIVRLGFVTIRNWTLVTAARSVFLAPGAGMMYQKIWTQSVLSAMTGQLVAQSLGRVDAESVFIGGLMQNIGQLVLARCQPVLFQEILVDSETSVQPYHEVERRYLGFDHGELGAILIREWNLSQELEEAVRWHHDFLNPEARNPRYAAMIALGEEIAWQSVEGAADPDAESGQAPEPSSAAKYLGVSAAQLAALKAEAAKLTIDPHFFN